MTQDELDMEELNSEFDDEPELDEFSENPDNDLEAF